MRQQKIDSLSLLFVFIVAMAAVGVAALIISIVDKSFESVQKVRTVNFDNKNESVSFDIVKNVLSAKRNLNAIVGKEYNCRITDESLSKAQLKELSDRNIINLKLLRCEFSPANLKVFQHSRLKYLFLSNCAVDDATFASIQSLPALEKLELYKCTGNLDGIKILRDSNLKMIRIRKQIQPANNPLSAAQIASLAQMTELIHLDISRNSIAYGTLNSLPSISKIAVLNLADTNFTEQDFRIFEHLPHLEYLNLSENPEIDCADAQKIAVTCHRLKQVRVNTALHCSILNSKLRDRETFTIPADVQFEKFSPDE